MLEVMEENKYIQSRPTSMYHRIYLYGVIEHHDDHEDKLSGNDKHIDQIKLIRDAGPDDVIEIRLNTPGGSLNTTISLISAILASEATIVAVAEGDVCSAGVPIFLACPVKMVEPYAAFMIHDSSYGEMGKTNELGKSNAAHAKRYAKMCADLLIPYYTEQEVIDMLDGKDLWLTAEEMEARIEAVDCVEEEEDDEDDEYE